MKEAKAMKIRYLPPYHEASVLPQATVYTPPPMHDARGQEELSDQGGWADDRTIEHQKLWMWIHLRVSSKRRETLSSTTRHWRST